MKTGMCPDEMFTGMKPTLYPHLIEFGRIGYVTVCTAHLSKMAECSHKCIMVGYALNHSSDAYRMYNPATNAILMTRDVRWSTWTPTQATTQIEHIFKFPVNNTWNDQPPTNNVESGRMNDPPMDFETPIDSVNETNAANNLKEENPHEAEASIDSTLSVEEEKDNLPDLTQTTITRS